MLIRPDGYIAWAGTTSTGDAGWRAALAHLVAVGCAWAYDLGLKSTVVSALTYAAAFALLPVFVTLGLPDDGVEEIFGKQADTVIAGTAVPGGGKAVPVAGGYRVSGRWSFGSGCQEASWMLGSFQVIGDDGEPRLAEAQGSHSPDRHSRRTSSTSFLAAAAKSDPSLLTST